MNYQPVVAWPICHACSTWITRREGEQHTSDALLQLIIFAFMVTWFGGIIVQYLRYRRKERDYLRRFPPVEGVPLDMYLGGNPFSPVGRAAIRAGWEPQDDPDLEELRREAWRGYCYLVLWIFGFPLLVVGVVILFLILRYPPW